MGLGSIPGGVRGLNPGNGSLRRISLLQKWNRLVHLTANVTYNFPHISKSRGFLAARFTDHEDGGRHSGRPCL